MKPSNYFFTAIAFTLVIVGISCKNEKPSSAGNTVKETPSVRINENLTAAFQKQFPNAQDITWDSLEIGLVANFFDGTHDCKVFYDAKGRFQYATTLLEFESLPTSVQNYIKANYKSAAIAIVQLVDDGKAKSYQIELENATDYIALEFDEKGKFQKEIKQALSPEELQRQEEEGVDENDNKE